MAFRIFWSRYRQLAACSHLFIRDSADALRIEVGDDVYIVSNGLECRLLARLAVLSMEHDSYRRRVRLTVGGPRSAYFYIRPQDATAVQLPDAGETHLHREATFLDPRSTEVLTTACGIRDFSLTSLPASWSAIQRLVRIAMANAKRDGDLRPEVEVAEGFLRRNYMTSQLPGPAPVYQNAARRALGFDSALEPSTYRERHVLTNDAIVVGINEDIATAHHTPDSKRHQEILNQLRSQLERLGFIPKYDGLVDCIVETDDTDIYFEVKSTTRETVAHQVRTGLGQVLHYIWIDSESVPRSLHGHLVVEGPWRAQDESLRVFVRSCSIGLTWSSEIDSLEAGDLNVTD